MRKLATIRKIADVQPIPNADAIEVVTVDGWQVVAKKGEFKVGDYAMYFEIDSALPANDERYEFLRKSCLKSFGGGEVLRIKTIKLRKQVSQGLLLPLDQFPEVNKQLGVTILDPEIRAEAIAKAEVDEVDFSEALGVVKYEREVHAPNAAGDFPHWIRKTDQPRIQNVFKRLPKSGVYTATLKLDGSSTTVAYITDPRLYVPKLEADEFGGQLVVCSRNNTLKPDTENKWFKGVYNSGLDTAAKRIHEDGFNIAIQGELLGPGIQSNHEGFKEYRVVAFAAWDIDSQEYLSYNKFLTLVEAYGIPCTPLIDTIDLSQFSSVNDYLEYAEKVKSPFSDVPEGVVFHKLAGEHHSFKSISNRYLLKAEK